LSRGSPIWRRQSDFLTDFQSRYDTETIPDAFFGIIRKEEEPVDAFAD